MKQRIFFWIFMLISFNLFTLQMNQYAINNIKIIKNGSALGEIGFNIINAYAGSSPGPKAFSIGIDNHIYVPDKINKRINVYDMNMAFRHTITEERNTGGYSAFKILVFPNSDIFCLSGNKHLLRFNNEGTLLFDINWRKLYYDVPDENFFIINNSILIYNREKMPLLIEKSGNILSNEESISKIETINQERENFISIFNISRKDSNFDKYQSIQKLKMSFPKVVVGNRLFSTKLYEHIEYYKKIENILTKEERMVLAQKKMQKQMKNNNIQLKAFDNIDFNIFKEPYFIGFDDCDNSYWQAEIHDKDNISKQVVFIVSMFGDIIEVFQYGERRGEDLFLDHYPATGSFLALAPNGDIYFMRGSEKGYNFYKITRRW